MNITCGNSTYAQSLELYLSTSGGDDYKSSGFTCGPPLNCSATGARMRFWCGSMAGRYLTVTRSASAPATRIEVVEVEAYGGCCSTTVVAIPVCFAC